MKHLQSCPIYTVLAHLSKSYSRTFQGLSRTIRRIYKHRKLTQRGLGRSPGRKWFYAHLRSERSHVEHLFQYQLVQLRHFRNTNSSTFKDLQTQIQGLSRTMSVFKDSPNLENLEKNSLANIYCIRNNKLTLFSEISWNICKVVLYTRFWPICQFKNSRTFQGLSRTIRRIHKKN